MTNLKRLFDPFPKEQITWRAQQVTKDGTKAMALAYIDARDVMNRLDEVCGIDGWQCKYSHANGKTICDIGIRCDVTPKVPAGSFLATQYEWIWKADGAGDTDIEAEKGAISDAFKRAAVKWGVGRYLYDLDAPWVPIECYEGTTKFKRFKESPWKYVKDKDSFTPIVPTVEPSAASNLRFETIQEELQACETPKALQTVLRIHTPAIQQIQSGDAQIRQQMNDTIKAAKEHVAMLLIDDIARHEHKGAFEVWWLAIKSELIALKDLSEDLYKQVYAAKDAKKNQLKE